MLLQFLVRPFPQFIRQLLIRVEIFRRRKLPHRLVESAVLKISSRRTPQTGFGALLDRLCDEPNHRLE